jgi:hypothetical protein
MHAVPPHRQRSFFGQVWTRVSYTTCLLASHGAKRLPSALWRSHREWDETFDIAADTGTRVDDRDYQVPFKLTANWTS